MEKNLEIILVHGFGKNETDMNFLKKKFINSEYSVQVINLPLTFHKIEKAFNIFNSFMLNEIKKYPSRKFVLIGHSTGSIIIQNFTKNFSNLNIHCNILICPPNKGSYLADIASKIPPISFILKTLSDITTTKINALNLKSQTIPQGIIMGVSNKLLFSKLTSSLNDGRVSISSALKGTYRDFIILKYHHKKIHFTDECFNQIIFFIKNFYFKK
ncbi:esterase/lipase family protein [Cetobacterium sp. SF1]|uniref:esterase/lipase family protein n=1 Tax=Cetobacterium sp. SF1 TaxID=3417654 RepID=UPI003CEF3882